MSRRLLLALVLALCFSGAARADLPAGSGTLSVELRIVNPNQSDFSKGISWVPPNADQTLHYFNLAHCMCSDDSVKKNDPHSSFDLRMQLHSVTTPLNPDKAVQVWSGTGCDDITTRNANCEAITGANLAAFNALLNPGPYDEALPIEAVIEPKQAGCGANAGTSNAFFYIDDGAGALTDVNATPINFDKQPPPLPVSPSATPGEGAIQIDFSPPTDGSTDIAYYQALCSNTDGSIVFLPPVTGPRYDRPVDVCGLDAAGIAITKVHTNPAQDVDAGVADAGVDGQPDANPLAPDASTTPDAFVPQPDAMPSGTGLESLDPKYICGEAPSTALGVRIEGLLNNVPYNVMLVAVDKSGNASALEFIEPVTPVPVTDFWEDAHDQGSQVESGFCLISDTYGGDGPITRAMRAFRDDTLGASSMGRAFTRFYYAHVAWLGRYARAWWPVRIVFALLLAPLVLVALAWHVLTLPGLFALAFGAWWLRRRRRASRALRVAMASATLVLVVASAGAAHAQSDPYWEQDAADADDTDTDIGVAEPDWIVGVKLGPYVPAIDAQFQAQTGLMTRPYHQMFGGYNLMPMLDVDHVLWRRFGQITVGGTLGFLSKSGNAFTTESLPTDDPRARSAGDTNQFRLIPMAAMLGYRFTYLDDRFGIPIVPYARGGFAYYMWWVKAPNGNLAFTGNGNCHPVMPTCPTQSAIGGSMGLQGSIGIEIRAERIDSDSAASMREGGIDHAGFYAELQSGWVDSFGDAHRFSLGDNTWFAGVNFEF